MSKALIAYIPVLHEGYIKLLSKGFETVYVLGKDLILEFPPLEREVRLVAPEDMTKVIKALNLSKKIEILKKKDLQKVGMDVEIVMPDEDSMRFVAEKYFPKHKITFERVFLRWDRPITLRENIVDPNRIISQKDFDKKMMELAFKSADKSSDWWRQVGAVAVKNEKVLFTGYNHHMPSTHTPYENGDPRNNFNAGEFANLGTAIHAEASIIAEAAKKGVSLDGAELYSSTFPCPVCAKSIVEAGFKKVYYSKGYSQVDAEKLFNQYGIEIVLVQ